MLDQGTATVADDAVRDNVTGLDWQRAPTASPTPFTDAQRYCGELKLGGFDDWRVPSLVELTSIWDPRGSMHAVPSYVLEPAAGTFTWTSTLAPGSSRPELYALSETKYRKWSINLSATQGSGVARCVRTFRSPPAPAATRYDVSTSGVARDTRTGLVWQRQIVRTGDIQTQAVSYCAQLVLAGFSDWRLPTIKELASLHDSTMLPTIDNTALPAPDTAYEFWSSSPCMATDCEGYGWVWNMSGGGPLDGLLLARAAVRCVR